MAFSPSNVDELWYVRALFDTCWSVFKDSLLLIDEGQVLLYENM